MTNKQAKNEPLKVSSILIVIQILKKKQKTTTPALWMMTNTFPEKLIFIKANVRQKMESHQRTFFFYWLRPNLPLVLCDRINLDHLLQVHFIGCARAQGQRGRGFPRGHSWVQKSTGSGGIQLPLSIIILPLPHWAHTESRRGRDLLYTKPIQMVWL